jgi:hypothetical protein
LFNDDWDEAETEIPAGYDPAFDSGYDDSEPSIINEPWGESLADDD